MSDDVTARTESPREGPAIAVIGLGAIGDGVARSVSSAGLPLIVCDVRPEATDRYAEIATVAGSPAEAAARADIVVVAVVDDAQVHAVLSGPDGGLAGAGPGTAVVVVSTITAQCVADLGVEAAAAGVTLLDCGVSGGPAAAASGDLICMVGGDEADVARLAPLFDAIGSLTVHMGPFGSGLAAKLARNLIQYGSWLAAHEGQVLAEAAGIELSKLAQVVRASDARIGGPATLMFRATTAPLAADDGLRSHMATAASLAHKDLQAALALAAGLDVALPLTEMTEARTDTIFGVDGPA